MDMMFPIQHLSLKDISDMNVIIYGPISSGKTSLLWQAAVELCKEGQRVTWLSSRPLQRLPLPVHGLSKPSRTVLDNIKIMYLDSVLELINYLSSLHEHETSSQPHSLLLDDLQSFITHEEMTEHTPALVLSLLVNATEFLQSCSPISRLLISCSTEKSSFCTTIAKKMKISTYFINNIDISEDDSTHEEGKCHKISKADNTCCIEYALHSSCIRLLRVWST